MRRGEVLEDYYHYQITITFVTNLDPAKPQPWCGPNKCCLVKSLEVVGYAGFFNRGCGMCLRQRYVSHVIYNYYVPPNHASRVSTHLLLVPFALFPMQESHNPVMDGKTTCVSEYHVIGALCVLRLLISSTHHVRVAAANLRIPMIS